MALQKILAYSYDQIHDNFTPIVTITAPIIIIIIPIIITIILNTTIIITTVQATR